MNKNDDIHQNFEITEQFIREYCSRTELETKARDAALLLLNQLEECRKLAHKEQEEPKQEDKKEEVKEETKEKAPKEEVQEEVEEPVISEEKFKKLQNARQGKKTYREYLRNQIQVIGMAGIIAMSTAVYSQSQIVYKNGIIMYAVLEKEFPILSTIKNLFSTNTSQSNNTNSNDNNSSQASTTNAASTASVANNNTSTPQSNSSADTSVTNEQSDESSSTAQLTPAEQEQIKKGEKILEDEAGSLNFKLQQFDTPIAPPTTTNTNPSIK